VSSSSPQARVLVVTDLVDSTALVERLTDERASELIKEVDGVARSLLVEHDGREIDKTDGYLLLFERAIDGVRYVLALHRGLAEISEKTGHSLKMRAGIHVGEVVVWENPPELRERGAKPIEVEGLAKPITARLMSLAPGGRTLLSRAARDLAVRAGSDLHFVFHGPYVLKGVSEPFEVYEVAESGAVDLPRPESTDKVRRYAPVSRARLGLLALGVGLALALVVSVGAWWSQRTTESLHGQLMIDGGGYDGLSALHPTDEGRIRVVRRAGRVKEVWFETMKGFPNPQAHQESYTVKGGYVRPPYRVLDVPRIAGLRQIWGTDRVERVEWLDSESQVVAIEHWEPDGPNRYRRHWTTASGAPSMGMGAPHTFSSRTTELDDRGREVWSADRRADVDLLFATRLTWSDEAMVLSFEDLVGNATPIDGVAKVSYRFDPDSRLPLGFEAVGIDGSPENFQDRASEVRVYTDDSLRTTFRTRDGETPVDRCPILERTRDGDAIIERCLDAEDNLIRDSRGVATERRLFDDRGQLVRIVYEDVDGKPAADRFNIAQRNYQYDDAGRTTWFGPNLGKDGEPIATNWGHFGYRDEFDRRGLLLSRTFVDGEGEPTETEDSYTTERWAYDSDGRPTEVRYLDADGEPALFKRTRHIVRFEWEEGGFGPSASSCFDLDDRPTAGSDGAHRWQWEWDANRTLLSVAGFSVDGDPVRQRISPDEITYDMPDYEGAAGGLTVFWCHALVTTLDDDGTTVGCEDGEGRPQTHRYGWSSISTRILDGGLRRETRLVEPDGTLAKAREGYGRKVERFERGQVVEIIRYDQNNELVDGCAVDRREYQPSGHPYRRSCFDRDGRPTPAENGCKVTIEEFDGYLRKAIRCRDEAGVPMSSALHEIERMSLVDLEFVYNDDNLLQKRLMRDASGGEYTIEEQFDERRRMSESVAYRDGEPALILRGRGQTHRLQREYDDAGNATENRRWPLPGGDLGRVPEVERFWYDQRGLKITAERWTHDGQPVAIDEIPHRTRYKYDRKQRRISRRGENHDGSAALIYGCYERKVIYGENTWRRLCVDTEGELMPMSTTGYEPDIRKTLDERVRIVSESAWGANGEPIRLKAYGVHEVRTEWNAVNEWVRRTSWGPDGERAASDSGVWAVVQELDRGVTPVAIRFLDLQEQPVMNNGCYGHALSGHSEQGYRPTSCFSDP